MAVQSDVVRLLIEHRTQLFAFIFAAMHDYHAAEEVFQDVSVVICNKANSWDPGSSFRSWAFEIARRQVLQFYRESQQRPGALSPSDLEHLASAFSLVEQESSPERRIEALRKCLSKVSGHAKKLFRLRYEEHLKLDQIAERVGGRSETVRKALYRGRIALRKCIDHQLGVVSDIHE